MQLSSLPASLPDDIEPVMHFLKQVSVSSWTAVSRRVSKRLSFHSCTKRKPKAENMFGWLTSLDLRFLVLILYELLEFAIVARS